MNVVIYGVEDISILQNYAIEFFWKVKNLQIARPVYTQNPFLPYDCYAGKLVKVIPVLDEDTVEFLWVVDNL